MSKALSSEWLHATFSSPPAPHAISVSQREQIVARVTELPLYAEEILYKLSHGNTSAESDVSYHLAWVKTVERIKLCVATRGALTQKNVEEVRRVGGVHGGGWRRHHCFDRFIPPPSVCVLSP
jgi:hypothetical protein